MKDKEFDHELEQIRREKIKKLSEEQTKQTSIVRETPIDLTETNFDDFINNHPVVFVDFWAEWCRPCQIAGPILDELSKTFAGKVWVGKVNVDQQRGLAMRYGANSIPTFWAFINGKPVQRFVGLYPKQTFGAIFRELVKTEHKR